ncbi:MAG: integrase core domain-containing protein [Candidatus Dojkabacteria bacterium]|nr:integrase core domain-containing protein [Candidatus Dojkabacteria bacterium]
MKDNTPTRAKHLLPFRYQWKAVFKVRSKSLSRKALMRLKWIDYIVDGNNILKASRHFDIPEPTIRYWYKRFKPHDLSSLEDKSRKPHTVRTSPVTMEEAQRVIEIRTDRRYQAWGKIKIQKKLKDEGIYIGQTRIQKIINEANLRRIPSSKKKYYKRKNRRHMYAVPKRIVEQPGGLVYLDVKHLYLPGGERIYQFTAIDHATRLMRIKLFTRITSRCGRMFLDYLQKKYPFQRIQYIGSDNGSEFLGEMDKELKKRNIKHVFSSPRSPKQNPFVERVIRTVIDEVYYFEGLEVTMRQQQERLNEFVNVYNEERPHHSLDLKTPIEQYMILLNHPNS